MIKSQITLKQLEAFVYVADTGTFRKAAAVLGTTQPNISVRIASMEETLGVVLMHRDPGSLRLTEKGEELLTSARKVLRAAEGLLEVAGRKDLIDERLRLGVSELIATTWLHEFLRALKKQYPALRVELTIDLSVELENQLSEGQLDLGLLNGPFRTKPSGLVELGTDRYGWVTTPEIARALGKTPDISAVFQQGIVSHGKYTTASAALRNHLKAQGLRPEQIVHSSSLNSCLHMAIDGMGVALLPRQSFLEETTSGRLVELDCDWSPEPLEFFARYDDKRAPLFVAEAASLSAEIALDGGR